MQKTSVEAAGYFAESLSAGQSLPLMIRPSADGTDLLDWAKTNISVVEAKLAEHGGILFRGFKDPGVESFQKFAEICSANGLIDYSFRSTPRTKVKGSIYTSTEYPADRSIPLHNEMSYTLRWPMKIWFYSVKAARKGGATPIANGAKVFERIDEQVRRKFMEHGVMYVRNYHEGIDLPYKEVFGTDDRAEIEAFCKGEGIECEFGNKDQLRTRQRCQAVFVHPRSGQTVWFNQAHLFHVSSLDPRQASSLRALYGEEGLPRNCYYGDGSPIAATDLDAVRESYRSETVSFPWKEGDVLMLDNALIAHGRDPFAGDRKVVVAMADKYDGAPFRS